MMIHRFFAVGAMAASLVLSLAGCSYGPMVFAAPDLGHLQIEAGSPQQASIAKITTSPRLTSGTLISPLTPVAVSVAAGRLTQVALNGPAGAVSGTMSDDATSWTSASESLGYGASYRITASAVDRIGLTTTLTGTFETVSPTTFLGFVTSPHEGAVVGVGLPLQVTLDHAVVGEVYQAELARRLAVSADGRALEGAWRWAGDQALTYRPKTYWPGNATVVLSAPLNGVQFGPDLWGVGDRDITFSTGPSMISFVDMATHQLTVTKDGATVRTIPITTGKPGFWTRSGIKVIEDKERARVMDAATGGTATTDPEYYRLRVEYAMRVTDSGEFLHAAPWSVAAQGHVNVSHGCTGMSEVNAKWLFENSLIGDVVVYAGTSRMMEPDNGIGIWNISWPAWLAGSAME